MLSDTLSTAIKTRGSGVRPPLVCKMSRYPINYAAFSPAPGAFS